MYFGDTTIKINNLIPPNVKMIKNVKLEIKYQLP